jgi:hypothetical protein
MSKVHLTPNEAIKAAGYLRRIVTQVFSEQQEVVALVNKLESIGKQGRGTTQPAK